MYKFLFLFLFITSYSIANEEEIFDKTGAIPTKIEKEIKTQPKIKEELKLKTIGEEEKDRFADNVKIQIINKNIAKSFNFNIKSGESVTYKDITITPQKCWKSRPYEMEENKVLIKVVEKIGKKEKIIFYGWMFSSSPALSSLNHKVYDIVIKNCEYLNKEEE